MCLGCGQRWCCRETVTVPSLMITNLSEKWFLCVEHVMGGYMACSEETASGAHCVWRRAKSSQA